MANRLYKTTTIIPNQVVPPGILYDTCLFQGVPQGKVWTGTVQVLQSPSNAFHQFFVGGILWAEWTGYQPSPAIQALHGESLELRSYGFPTGFICQATLIGREDDDNSYEPIWPNPGFFPDAATPIKNIAISSLPFSTTLDTSITPVTGSVLAIQFADAGGGSATGLTIIVQNSAGPGFGFLGPNSQVATVYPLIGPSLESPWWFVPIVGMSSIRIAITGILNKNTGGQRQGTLRLQWLNVDATDLWTPVLQPPAAQQILVGNTTNEVAVPATTTQTLLPEPASGTAYRVRGIYLRYTAAPAAAAGCVLRGTGSSFLYWSTISPAAVAVAPNSGPCSFIVNGANSRADPAEGLAFTNNSSVNGNIAIDYDILPFPQLGLVG